MNTTQQLDDDAPESLRDATSFCAGGRAVDVPAAARAGETVVRIGTGVEAGTDCSHCRTSYHRCSVDVMRELRDPLANDGCCDACRDASGHETRRLDQVAGLLAESDAELAALRAKVARVEALADRWQVMGETALDQANRDILPAAASSLRRALADPAPVEQQDDDPTCACLTRRESADLPLHGADEHVEVTARTRLGDEAVDRLLRHVGEQDDEAPSRCALPLSHHSTECTGPIRDEAVR